MSCVNRPMTMKPTNYFNYRHQHPPPPSASTCAAWCRGCGWHWTPPSPLVAFWPADGGLRVKTAEHQPDAGTECEGRRGRAPDLSEWGRPAREMYSLPLLYRNPSPYEYYHRAFTWHGRVWWWWSLARMLFALAEEASTALMNFGIRLILLLVLWFSSVEHLVFHRFDFPKHRIQFVAVCFCRALA